MRQSLRVDSHEFADQHETGTHAHERHQLTYTKSGVLSVEIAGARWVVPPLRAVWIPSNVVHSIRAHGSTSARLAFIDDSLDFYLPNRVTVIQASPLLRELIEELCTHANDTENSGSETNGAGKGGADTISDAERAHLEALLCLHLERHATRASPVEPLLMSELLEPRLAAIEQVLRRTPSDRRSLRQWGAFCGSSERTLSRLFQSEAGTTFSLWRTQLRMQHAVVQLAGGHSVTNTAHECGYNSTSAFIESFQSTLGTTPGQYFTVT